MIKYPKTPRSSEIMSKDIHREWRHLTAIVEEKVDGANSGVFFENGKLCLQSRGHVLRGGDGEAQFAPMHSWAAFRLNNLRSVLKDRFVLFGEWCFYKHRAYYDALPDWFLAFDVFDRSTGTFLPTNLRDATFKACNVSSVPRLWEGSFGKAPAFASFISSSKLKSKNWKSSYFIEESRIGKSGTDMTDSMEGVYIRVENSTSVIGRMKLHREGFEKVRNDDWGRIEFRNSKLL